LKDLAFASAFAAVPFLLFHSLESPIAFTLQITNFVTSSSLLLATIAVMAGLAAAAYKNVKMFCYFGSFIFMTKQGKAS
jgi:hypothetical protein